MPLLLSKPLWNHAWDFDFAPVLRELVGSVLDQWGCVIVKQTTNANQKSDIFDYSAPANESMKKKFKMDLQFAHKRKRFKTIRMMLFVFE